LVSKVQPEIADTAAGKDQGTFHDGLDGFWPGVEGGSARFTILRTGKYFFDSALKSKPNPRRA